MIRPIIAMSLCASLIGVSAAATPSPVEKTFGNTIVSTYPDGRTAELWLHAGGGYTAKGRRGDGSSGTWRMKGSRLCLKQSRPFPAPFNYCTAIPTNAEGVAWSAKAVTGEAISVRLVKGVRSGRG